MPQEYKEWTLIKEYENFGLYTNGKWRECFSKFDVGLIERKTLHEVNAEMISGRSEQWMNVY